MKMRKNGGKNAVILALATALVLKLFVFDITVAQGQSMEPAIHNGDVLIVNLLRYGLRLRWSQGYLIKWAQPRVGEVVVFHTPTGELAVKRVGALTEDGYFFAEGDNRPASFDSHSYGLVPIRSIIGKVLGR